jgi:hypothetical protein
MGGQMQPAELTIFGDRLEVGQNVEREQLDRLQEVFDRFSAVQRR